MENSKIVVGQLIDDEMLVKVVTTPEHLEWIKWLGPEELTTFFEELLNLVTQIAQEKEPSETLAIFLDQCRANAAINAKLYGSRNITDTVQGVADALGIDIDEAVEHVADALGMDIDEIQQDVENALGINIAAVSQELKAPGIDISEPQWKQEIPASNIYTEPEPTIIDVTEQERDHYLAQSIFELELSVRAHNCLERAKIKTVRELVIKTERELLAYKSFGRVSLLEIKEKLANIGLYLGMDLDDEDYEEDEDLYEEDTESVL